MKATSILKNLALTLGVLGLLVGGIALHQSQVAKSQAQSVKASWAEELDNLSASLQIPTTVALYEDTLASGISKTATSFTLVRGTDKENNSLASSTYGFILSEGSANEEFVLADCTATACTNVVRGISVITGTTTVTSLRHEHRKGDSAKITGAPIIPILARIINGQDTFPNALYYTSLSSTTIGASTNGKIIVTKDYSDFVGTTGCADANSTTRGCVEIATLAEAAAGTANGGSGAALVVPTSISSSTPYSGTQTGTVPTSVGRYLTQSWLDLTAHWIFSSLFATNASSTNATTTRMWVTGVTSSIVKTDSLGKLTAATAGTDYPLPKRTYTTIAGVSTGATSCSNNCSVSVVATSTTILIPSTAISASSTIQIIGYGNFDAGSANAGSGSGCSATVYDNATFTALGSLGGSSGGANDDSGFNANLFINFQSSVSSQKNFTISSDKDGSGGSSGTSAVDFSSDRTLAVRMTGSANAAVGESGALTDCTLTGYTVIVN